MQENADKDVAYENITSEPETQLKMLADALNITAQVH